MVYSSGQISISQSLKRADVYVRLDQVRLYSYGNRFTAIAAVVPERCKKFRTAVPTHQILIQELVEIPVHLPNYINP